VAGRIPDETVHAFARSIFQAASGYGFGQVDTIRLVNALMDLSAQDSRARPTHKSSQPSEVIGSIDHQELNVQAFPLTSPRLKIRHADPTNDLPLMESWLKDKYGQHFRTSCATARQTDPVTLLTYVDNHLGIILLEDGKPIGVMAFLDHDKQQRRAELRKLIGEPDERGKGYAEEATVLWLKYGIERLGLEKIYVSTLQNHLRNIQLNESVGFRIEGVLADEVLIDGERMDVLRMGFSHRRRGSSS
jgi:RimJ/RimL family protein N-acetyltransferase